MKIYSFLLAAMVLAAAVDARRASDTDCGADFPTEAPAKNGSVIGAAHPSAVPVDTPAAPGARLPTATTVPVANTPAAPAAKQPTATVANTPAAPGARKSDNTDDEGPAKVSPAKEQPAATPAPSLANTNGATQTKAGAVKSQFSYVGKDAGGPGTYDMVTDFATCAKTKQVASSPVSPLDDDVTLVFRGPMNIYNIAVFDGSSGQWSKVSSYEKGGAASNLVFLNNRNIDYGGKSSPQGFSNADGTGVAQQSTPFAGALGAASKPNSNSVYADEKTGAEVHIMTSKKCGVDGECKGYYDKDGTAFHGWGGAKKIFVTKVNMPAGGAPNLPAIWMLNAQIVRSSQYQCNCRGMGKGGGCGELDIAEVIEKDTNVMATHYYFYDGGSAPGHDSFGKRPFETPATYVTIIDDSYGVKVLELGADDFDFGCSSISPDVVSQWQKA